MSTNYGDAEYWDKRYEEDQDAFDWYQNYVSLQPFLETVTNKDDLILMLGCGNSNLSIDMYNDGYKTITNIDISEIVIGQCKEKFAESEHPGLIYEYGDALNMEDQFNENTFDVVLDKGTFDAIMCGDSGDAIRICEQVWRVLKPNGKYIVISYGKPKDREFYMEQAADWTIEIQTLQKSDDYQDSNSTKKSVHYIYIMTKPSK